jgi:hypothetical protein
VVEKKEEKAPASPASGGIAARTFARRATDDAKIAQAKVSNMNYLEGFCILCRFEKFLISSLWFPYNTLILLRQERKKLLQILQKK